MAVGPAAGAPPRTVVELLRLAEPYLARHGCPTPRLDAEVLLAHVLGTTRLELYTRLDQPLQRDEVDAYREALRRRAAREPVAYIVGHREFYGLRFQVGPGVLVPRPETEYLVELALRAWQAGAQAHPEPAVRFADVGTGCGALAVTLAVRQPAWRGVGSDVSDQALGYARANARSHGVGGRLSWVRGDALSWAGGQSLDLVVTNPPYIPTPQLERLAPEIRRHEPRVALDGGPDGLAVANRIASQAARVLRPGGLLLMELGTAEQARALARRLGGGEVPGFARAAAVRDPAGGAPVLVARAAGSGPLGWPATAAEEMGS